MLKKLYIYNSKKNQKKKKKLAYFVNNLTFFMSKVLVGKIQ